MSNPTISLPLFANDFMSFFSFFFFWGVIVLLFYAWKKVCYLDELVNVLLRLSELSPVSPRANLRLDKLIATLMISAPLPTPLGGRGWGELNNEVQEDTSARLSRWHKSVVRRWSFQHHSFFSDIWICIDFHYFLLLLE